MEILNFNTLIELVLIVLFGLYWKFTPNNVDMKLKVKKLEKMCYQLSEGLEVDRIEMWEHIEGTLKPLTNRLKTRIQRAERAEEKDLSMQDSIEKKGGIIRGSQLKKHGAN